MDARVASDMILLSSRVAGWVTERPAREGARIAAGAPLLVVDDRQARLRRDELDAALATLDAQVEAVQLETAYVRAATASRIESAESELVAARSELDAAGSIRETMEDEWRRADTLRERKPAVRARLGRAPHGLPHLGAGGEEPRGAVARRRG